MSAAAICMIVWFALALGVVLALHGKRRTGRHSFWRSLLRVGIVAALLYWGGFFAGVAA